MYNDLVKNLLTSVVAKALLKVGLSASNPIGAIISKLLVSFLMGAVEDLKFEIQLYNKYKKDLEEGKKDETNLQNAQSSSDIITAINNSR